MQNNPVTDKHLYGPMGFEDTPYKRRKKLEKKELTLEDFEDGLIVTCIYKNRDGFSGHFLCQIIQAYESDIGSRWAPTNKLKVYAIVRDVEHDKYLDLIGKIVQIIPKFFRSGECYFRDEGDIVLSEKTWDDFKKLKKKKKD